MMPALLNLLCFLLSFGATALSMAMDTRGPDDSSLAPSTLRRRMFTDLQGTSSSAGGDPGPAKLSEENLKNLYQQMGFPPNVKIRKQDSFSSSGQSQTSRFPLSQSSRHHLSTIRGSMGGGKGPPSTIVGDHVTTVPSEITQIEELRPRDSPVQHDVHTVS